MKMSDKMEIVKYLCEKSNANRFDYEKIKSESVTFLNDLDDGCFINFILTVKGRLNFTEAMYKSFSEAKEAFGERVCFTIVEHSEAPEHSKFYRNKKANYVFIRANPGEQFNKCLSYNMGVLCSSPSKYYLFHDIDILVRKDFFEKIMSNLNKVGAKAIQCYTKRRVLNCNLEITNMLLSGKIDVNSLGENSDGVNPPMYNGQPSLGSKGGSILLESELFFEAGGYDPELFRAYSAEDNFFWEKISSLTEIAYADEPAVELFHMWHEPQFGKNPFLYEMERDYVAFKGLSDELKRKFIDEKRKLLVTEKTFK
jgi:hypothetical protein